MKYRANGVQVVGLNKVIRSIEKMGVEVSDLKSVFTRIGARAMATANSATPVKSGALVRSNKQSKRKNSVYLYSGSARVPYARFVHWGTSLMERRPYLSAATEKDGPWAVQELEKELEQITKRVGLK